VTQQPHTVLMPVEFHRGAVQTVRLDRPAKDFAKLRPEFWSGPGEITLPPDQFRYDKVVPDVAIAVCGAAQPEPVADRAPSDRGGAVVVVLESPHEAEYGPNFTPVGPLRRPASRTKLRNQLPQLLEEAGLDWGAVQGAEVVLANPVQLQTSLHRLMQPDFQTGVQGGVRDQVWRALTNLAPIREDFIQRMHFYRPALVINACTATLRDAVQATLESLPYQARKVNQHPSYWSRLTTFI
jgi:hypothetical protein